MSAAGAKKISQETQIELSETGEALYVCGGPRRSSPNKPDHH